MIKNFLSALLDLIRIHFPSRKVEGYSFAFLIHPRDTQDVYLKFAFFRYLPSSVTYAFTKNFWPITMSRVTGLKSFKDGRDIPGWVISIPLTARQIMEDKDLAFKHIIKALRLARSRGVKIIGLGALLSTISRRGLDLVKENMAITTGHAYTIYNVTQTLLAIAKEMKRAPENSVVAIVGASGSIGAGSALILSDHEFKKIILIDVVKKNKELQKLVHDIKTKHPNIVVETSHQVKDVIEADFVVTATNAPEALVKADDLKAGAVVIDDAQPTDIHDSVFMRDDVLVLEAGAVHTPGISAHLKLGLNGKYDNFSCMAELLILSSAEYIEHYAIGQITTDQVREIGKQGERLNFRVADYQNERELITPEKIQRVMSASYTT